MNLQSAECGVMSDRSNDSVFAVVDEVRRKTEFLQSRVDEVRDQVIAVEDRVGRLEDQMRSANTHLTSLVSEAKTTNAILREDIENRKKIEKQRFDLEKEDREWRRKVEERRLDEKAESADLKRTFVKEAWEIFKQPFGMLVTGVLAWIVWRYFQMP